MILQNVFRTSINKTYNIHGAHPPNRAPRDRLRKRQPLQRWRQPPTCWPQARPAVARRQSSPSSPPRCLACCNRDLEARISGSLATFQDPRSKGVGARQPYRAIVAVVPFRRVHRARPVAIQPRTSHSAPHWQVCSELLNSVIAMLLVQESNGSVRKG